MHFYSRIFPKPHSNQNGLHYNKNIRFESFSIFKTKRITDLLQFHRSRRHSFVFNPPVRAIAGNPFPTKISIKLDLYQSNTERHLIENELNLFESLTQFIHLAEIGTAWPVFSLFHA
jgi:hypothetical protein